MKETKTEFQLMIEANIAAGHKVHQPNGLPLKCIKHDGNMYEHEHGDHPTYMFPVEMEYTGPVEDIHRDDYRTIYRFCGMNAGEFTDDDVRQSLGETHALIYTDGNIALTLYECCYAMFSMDSGVGLYGRFVSKNHRLSDASLKMIREKMEKHDL